MKRTQWIDALKGAAILMVVWGHLSRMTPFKMWIYSFHVPLFFFISGYLLYANPSWRDKSIRHLFTKKLRSLLYPYLTFSILTVLLQLILHRPGEAVLNAAFSLFLFGAKALWFLPALFFAEILSLLLLKKLSRRGQYAALLFGILFSALFCTFVRPAETESLVWKLLNNELIFWQRILLGAVFIGIGYACARPLSALTSLRSQLAVFALCAAVNLSLFRFNFADVCSGELGNPFLFYINALSGSVGMLLLFRIIGDRLRLLPYLGRNSIIIFVTHQNLGIIEIGRSLLPDPLLFLSSMVIELLLIYLLTHQLRFLLRPDFLRQKTA